MSQNAVKEISAEYFAEPQASAEPLITEHLDIWTSAISRKNSAGRGSSQKYELYGIKKLRELILELAVRGRLVPQDPSDEPASELLKRVVQEKAQLVKEGKIRKPKASIQTYDKEKPFEIPAGWAWTRIEEFSEIAPRNDVDDVQEAGFVPMPLIGTGYKGEHGQEVRPWSEIKKGYTHFADGDIAVAKITPCFENSKAVVFSGLNGGVGAGTTELHVARPISKEIDRFFILLYLKSPQFLLVGETKMTGSAGQKRVPTYFFSRNPMPLPPAEEQYRIVAKVDELMALCDQLENQTEQSLDAHATLVETLLDALNRAQSTAELTENWQRLEANWDILLPTTLAGERAIDKLKQTILQLAVMGKLVPQDPSDEPAIELLKRLATEKEQLIKNKKIKKQKSLPPISDDEKPFELPDGWEWCRFDSLSSMVTSGSRGWKAYYSNYGSVFIRSQDIKKDKLEFDKKAFVDLPKATEGVRTKVAKGDLLLTITGANVAKAALIEDAPVDSYVSQHVALIRLVDTDVGVYLHKWLTAEQGGRNLLLESSYGAKPGLNLLNIRELLIPMPPLKEQERIVVKVDQLIVLCDQLKQRLQTAQKIQQKFTDAAVSTALTENSEI